MNFRPVSNLAEPVRLTPLQGAAFIAGVVVIGLVCWFLALYPLIPSTPQGWFSAVASGLVVIAWAAICVVALQWLQRRQRYVLFFKGIGAIVAISLGLGVFCAAYEARDFLATNYSYFGR